MKKIILKHNDSINNFAIIEYVVSKNPKEKHLGYLRLQDRDDVYLGSLSDRQLKSLYLALKIHFGDKK